MRRLVSSRGELSRTAALHPDGRAASRAAEPVDRDLDGRGGHPPGVRRPTGGRGSSTPAVTRGAAGSTPSPPTAPAAPMPVLYGADDLAGALAETVFHDVPVRGT